MTTDRNYASLRAGQHAYDNDTPPNDPPVEGDDLDAAEAGNDDWYDNYDDTDESMAFGGRDYP